MGKKENQWRMEGMAYALRIAEGEGLNYLKEDLKKRGALGIPVGISNKDLEEFSNVVKENMLDSILIMTVATLHDEFGFGAIRCQKFIDRFMKKADCLADNYATFNDYIQMIKDELGFELKLRRREYKG